MPFRLVSRIAFHSESGNSSVGVRLVRPAQLTRMCNAAEFRGQTCRRWSRLEVSVTSQVWTSDCRPSALTSETAARHLFGAAPEGTTFAPACAAPG